MAVFSGEQRYENSHKAPTELRGTTFSIGRTDRLKRLLNLLSVASEVIMSMLLSHE